MEKAVFLDRDGTIIKEKDYLDKIEEIELLDNALSGLKLLQDNNYLLFVVSNQSGVARGYFTEQTVNEINNYLQKLLLKEGIKIEQIYYCPHHKDGKIEKYKIDCDCRKPKTGMINVIVDNYNINLSASFVLGDKMSDIDLANNCECNSILLQTGYGLDEMKKGTPEKINVATDLLDAAKKIINYEYSKIKNEK